MIHMILSDVYYKHNINISFISRLSSTTVYLETPNVYQYYVNIGNRRKENVSTN